MPNKCPRGYPSFIRILCFGDSNTWGYISGSNYLRHEEHTRWTKLLAAKLGSKHEVIEEGLNGRTIFVEDLRPGSREGKNAAPYIIPCLDSHDPLDWVIVMLGTNDMKIRFNLTGKIILEYLAELLKRIASHKSLSSDKTAKLLAISPPMVDVTRHLESSLGDTPRFSDCTQKVNELAEGLKELTAKCGWAFLDGRELETGIDGVHLSPTGHAILAEKVFEALTK